MVVCLAFILKLSFFILMSVKFWGVVMAKDHEVTRVLQSISEGDDSAVEKLMPLVYSEFKQLARGYMSRERSDHTLQATS